MFASNSSASLAKRTTRSEVQDSESAVSIAMSLSIILIFVFLLCASPAQAYELYKTFQTPEVFLQEVFDGKVPPPKVLELSASDQQAVAKAFQRDFPLQRLRYWEEGKRSVWIFDDIGKEGYVPTTCGFVISDGKVETAKVLIYRESRGEQVAEPSFLEQIEGAKATDSGLNVEVDNITGATLSVKMMERMAWTALVLDSLTH